MDGAREIGDAEVAGRAESGECDLYLGADLLVAAEEANLATRSLNAIQGFVTLLDELTEKAGAAPGDVLEAVLDRTGYLAELRASADPQDEGRVENLEEEEDIRFHVASELDFGSTST